ncbi:MAG: site-2 protease family protein [Candidatus Pacebacteria bacterium]|nr:site-2 protease family protein [Candidatus Paceibacterota bacterium]
MNYDSIAEAIQNITTWILPLLFAITMHEAAHGFAAARLGDDTALRLGRVTLNPFKHIDPVGTVLIPGLLLLFRSPFILGWAKPVPVNFARLRRPKIGMALVAAAGPGVNIVFAIISSLALWLIPYVPDLAQLWLTSNLQNAISINIFLAVFNLLPLPPLDGGRILVGLLPRDLSNRLAQVEPYGFFIIIGLLFLIPMLTGLLSINFDPGYYLIRIPTNFVLSAIVGVFAP